MSGWEIALVVCIAVAFAVAVAAIVYNKIKHRGSCDCGGDCAACGGCRHTEKKAEKAAPEASCPHCTRHQ